MAKPCCAKCGSENIGTAKKFITGEEGYYVYCTDCGAIITWIADETQFGELLYCKIKKAS